MKDRLKEAVILMKTKNVYKSNGMKKIFQLLFSEYKWHLLFVLLGILGSALATVKGTLFLQTLIDDYITPLISSDSPDFAPLIHALLTMAGIYGIGLICSFAYNRIMVNVGQGTMRKVRTQLFTHMESLPIKYFDTHAHGDIMSVYTNDTDTLRQFVGISLPQLLNSFISIISVFVSMIILNIPLTILTVAMIIVMFFSTRIIAGKSGKYFARQQQHLGEVNGYIEEMMGGQKVIKVFCHEEESLKDFRKKNEQLRDSSDKANGYANILMPVIVQLGNVSYVLCAIAGATLALNGYAGLTIGTLISFLTLNKSFNQPFGQISQQLNSVIMAQAGIDRIFTILDEIPETDEGHVTLVDASIDKDGHITESDKHTGKWAWKDTNPSTGETTFEELRGDIVFKDVDFGYTGLLYDEESGSWYYIEDGKVRFDYTGLVKHNDSLYYVDKGLMNMNYSGEYKSDGHTYVITNGYVTQVKHSWDDGVTVTEATCTDNGIIRYTCKSCDKTKEEVIKAKGHEYSWVVAKPATTSEEGLEEYKCLVCGDVKETRKLEKLQAEGDKKTDNNNVSDKNITDKDVADKDIANKNITDKISSDNKASADNKQIDRSTKDDVISSVNNQ